MRNKNKIENIQCLLVAMHMIEIYEPKKVLDQGRINTEDIFAKAFELNKDTFGWQKEEYKDFPDNDKLRRILETMRKLEYCYGHKGTDLNKEGYTMTQKGVQLAKDSIHLYMKENQTIAPPKANNLNDKFKINFISRLKQNKFYKLFLMGEKHQIEDDINIFDIAEMLGTSINDLARLNLLFDDAKKWVPIYDRDSELSNYLMFLTRVAEEKFPEQINFEILRKAHMNDAKAKNKIWPEGINEK